MADDLSDLMITVGGDTSDLQAALDSIPAAAQNAAQGVKAAFDPLAGAFNTGEDAVNKYGASVQDLIAQQIKAEAVMQSAKDVLAQMTDLYKNGEVSVNTFARAQQQLDDATKAVNISGQESESIVTSMVKAYTGFFAVEEILTTLKDAFVSLASAAVETANQIQKSTIALTALKGDVDAATQSINLLKVQALDQALSFPSLIEANQKVIALGFSARQASDSLRVAADAAAATGKSFDSIPPAMDRIAQSGMLSARQLATLGLSLSDVAKAAGTTTTQVSAAFKAMDQGQRLDLLITAMGKFAGTAEATAQTVGGQFTNLKTEMDLALAGAGQALTPFMKQMLDLAQIQIMPAIQGAVSAFQDLSKAVGPLVSGTLTLLANQIHDVISETSVVVTDLSRVGDSLVNWATDGKIAHVNWNSFTDDLQDLNPIHDLNTAIEIARGTIDMFATSTLIMGQRFQNATEKITGLVDPLRNVFVVTKDFQTGLLGVRLEMEKQQTALDNAKAKLQLLIEAKKLGIATDGMVEDAEKAVNKAMDAMDPAAGRARDALKKLDDQAATFVTHTNQMLSTLPKTLDQYNASLENGGKTIKAMLTEVDKAIAQSINNMQAMGGATNDMLVVYGKLQQEQQKLKDLADQDTLGKIAEQVASLARQFPSQFMALDGATRQWVTDMIRLYDSTTSVSSKEETFMSVLNQLKGAGTNAATALQAVEMGHNRLADAANQGTNAQSNFIVKIDTPAFVGPLQKNAKLITDLGTAHQTTAAQITADSGKIIDGVTQGVAAIQNADTNLKTVFNDMPKATGSVVTAIANLDGSLGTVPSAVDKITRLEVGATDQTTQYGGSIKDLGQAIDLLMQDTTSATGPIQIITGSMRDAAAKAAEWATGVVVLNGTIPKTNSALSDQVKIVEGLGKSWDDLTESVKHAVSAEQAAAKVTFGNAATGAGTALPGGGPGTLNPSGVQHGSADMQTFGSTLGIQTQGSANLGTASPGAGQFLTYTIGIGVNTLGVPTTINLIPGTISGVTKSIATPSAPVETDLQKQIAAAQALVDADTKQVALMNQALAAGAVTQDQVDQVNAALQADYIALLKLEGITLPVTTGLTNLGNAVTTTADAAVAAGTALTQSALQTSTFTAAVLGTITNAIQAVGPNTNTSTFGILTPTIGPNGIPNIDLSGNAPVNTNVPSVGTAPGGSSFGGVMPSTGGLTVNVNAGTIVGQNGMQQLADIIQQNIVTKLQQTVGLKVR